MKSRTEYILEELKIWWLMIWTFPQTIIGLFLSIITGAKPCKKWINGVGYDFYVSKRFNNTWSGVSLGEFIVFAKEDYADDESIKHEYGHHIQSNYFGWFYLLLVGLPSVIGNLWDRIAHSDWSIDERIYWYYRKLPWERWADLLGGVNRGF